MIDLLLSKKKTRLEEKKEAENMQAQIKPIFTMYYTLIKRLTKDQMIWKFQYQIQGLEMCLRHGQNKDRVPDPILHRYEKYYEWYYWHEFTQMIVHQYNEAATNHDLFLYYSMLSFISLAHQYLVFLKIL